MMEHLVIDYSRHSNLQTHKKKNNDEEEPISYQIYFFLVFFFHLPTPRIDFVRFGLWANIKTL